MATLQSKIWKDTVSIWIPIYDQEGLRASDVAFNEEPDYEGVRCMFHSTPEVDKANIIGRTKESNIFTLDRFSFFPDQDILDNYAIVLTTAGHPDYGGCWMVQGNPQTRSSTGLIDHKKVYGKRGPIENGMKFFPFQPGAPANLLLTPDDQQITVAWDPGEGATFYTIQRSTVPLGGGPYTTVGTSTDLDFVDTGLANGDTYWYRVFASNANGDSGYSDPASATAG